MPRTCILTVYYSTAYVTVLQATFLQKDLIALEIATINLCLRQSYSCDDCLYQANEICDINRYLNMCVFILVNNAEFANSRVFWQ